MCDAMTNLIEKIYCLPTILYMNVGVSAWNSHARTYYVGINAYIREWRACARRTCTLQRRERDVHRSTLSRRPPRIHFRGKIKFRWVVRFSRVLSYFIIHEGTFLPVDSLARSSASGSIRTADGVSSNLPRVRRPIDFSPFLYRQDASPSPKFQTDRYHFFLVRRCFRSLDSLPRSRSVLAIRWIDGNIRAMRAYKSRVRFQFLTTKKTLRHISSIFSFQMTLHVSEIWFIES